MTAAAWPADTRARASHWRGPLRTLAATVSAILLIFARDAGDMAAIWWTSSTYGHCLFVLPIAGWLVWQRRDELAPLTPRAWWPGLWIAGAGALGWLLGEAAGAALVRHASLVLMLQAAAITLLGPVVMRAIAFPLFYLVFLVPFGEEFVAPMQTLTAHMAMGLLGLAGVPASLDGVFITIPNGWFEVAEACSGVKFLVAMVAYGALVANVCFRSWKRRIAFMALAIVVPIIANGLRAFGTIWIAHLTSADFAVGFDHVVYGWVFFALVMALVMAIGWPFFDRKPGEAWLRGLPEESRKGPRRRIVALALVGIMLIPVAWEAAIAATTHQRLPNRVSLPEVAGWERVPIASAQPWAPRFAGADHELIGRYRDDAGNEVDLAIALYGWQAEGREVVGYGQGAVPPESGWAWAADRPAPRGGKAERILGRNALAREVVSFYVIGGRGTGSVGEVKLATLKARLLGGDQSAIAVLVSAEEREGRPARPAIDRFLRALGPVDVLAQRTVSAARGS